MSSNKRPSPKGPEHASESLQVPKQSFFGRLRFPNTDSGGAYTSLAQTNQIDKLYLRCEELTMQSQVNQEMFEQSRQDLHEKDVQVQALQALKTELSVIIDQQAICLKEMESEMYGDGSSLQDLANHHSPVSGALLTNNAVVVCQNCSNTDGNSESSGYGSLDEKLESKDDETDRGNISKIKELTEQLKITDKRCRALESENSALATQLAKTNAIAREREELFATLNGQHHELMNLYVQEKQIPAPKTASSDD